VSDSRPLYAGRRLSSNQFADSLFPEEIHASGFDDNPILRRVLGRFTFVRLSDTHLRWYYLRFDPNAHHHDF
jgi:hypothetical protein